MRMKLSSPIEELAGGNRFCTRQRLGNVHCMLPVREQIRAAREGLNLFTSVPRPLRRGFYLLCLQTISENRATFLHVSRGSVPARVQAFMEHVGGES